jgi:pSer/pThr/pTyr-binding forkhead associated (FHA) protein
MLSGQTIISELIRNMEQGRFELAYTVLLPCAFSIYLNPEDYAHLAGVFDLIAEDAKRALRARVSQLNAPATVLGLRVPRKPQKEFKIATRDWIVEFLADAEVPAGDIEIHSELNEASQPGYCGTKTTLMNREPSVTTGQRTTSPRTEAKPTGDQVLAEIRYEDDSGAQLFLVTQNEIRIGRGGDGQAMDLALYSNDEVSREHLVLRREAATGVFLVEDKSTNGTWLDGKRLRRGIEEILPNKAEIGVAEVLTLSFEVRR